MNEDEFNKQLQQFTTAWHEMLAMEKKLGLQDEFPNFVVLSTNEITIIDMVAKNPDIIMKDICEALMMPKSTLTSIINRLEKKGYINRTIARRDLRSYGLVLTEKGVETQREHKEYEKQVFRDLLLTLEPEERTSLLSIMNKIINGIL